jgi:hypothetical protein
MRSAGMLNRSFLFLKIDLSSQRTVRILPSMSELQRLRQEGFELASQWRSPECRVHRGAFPGSDACQAFTRSWSGGESDMSEKPINSTEGCATTATAASPAQEGKRLVFAMLVSCRQSEPAGQSTFMRVQLNQKPA